MRGFPLQALKTLASLGNPSTVIRALEREQQAS
jgi:hypothetical protein